MREFIFQTIRLGFSEWHSSDLNLAIDLWGDPLVARFISAKGAFSKKEISERLLKEIQNNLNYQVQYWPLFELEDGKMIGCCGLRPYNKEIQAFELGFHLKSEYWGKGYAFEAASAVLDHARHNLNTDYIVAGHHPENTASAKLLGKLGFEYTRHEYYEATGLEHPTYILKITPSQ
ncbi:GNAT family N-acetyltransferase [Paenibacillus sp. CAA11]|uniref:GNAT family N-acetyltransferase n=1 Tax=Paenibacillus sp. CAA11 TaxID=1532905 RepID=UPI0018FFD35C|nr:GNAT family N-acetyltransferase [Paenibacillus sp. CAA11]